MKKIFDTARVPIAYVCFILWLILVIIMFIPNVIEFIFMCIVSKVFKVKMWKPVVHRFELYVLYGIAAIIGVLDCKRDNEDISYREWFRSKIFGSIC